MKEPLLAPFGALAAGVSAARLIGFDAASIGAAAVAFLALCILARSRALRRLTVVSFLLALAAAGGLLYELHRPGAAPELDAASGEMVILSGCVVTPPARIGDYEQFLLELEPGARARVNLYFREGETPPALKYGQTVEVTGRVRTPRNFGNPGAFDYAGWLARQQIYWTDGANAVRVIPGRCGSPIAGALFHLRQSALERIDRLYSGDAWASAMMKATLLGDSTALEKVWTDSFRRTGTYHALVISGMHVSVLAGVLLFVLRFLPLGEFGALTLAVVLAWLYAVLAGMQAPVMRGAGGFTCFLIARFFYRRARILNLLAVIAIGFILADPEQMFEPSFQLSFVCVALIGAFAVPLMEVTSAPYSAGLRWLADTDRDMRLQPKVAQFRIELRLAAEAMALWIRVPVRWVVGALGLAARGLFFAWELLVLSAVVQFGLTLPMIAYFHRLSYTGLSANLLVVPLMSIVVPVGFLAMFTGSAFIAKLAWVFLRLARVIVDWHAQLETTMRIPDPPVWLAASFVISLVILFAAIRVRSRLFWPSLVAAGTVFVLLLAHPFPPKLRPGYLELTAIDVGQGESLLVALPDGKLMVVDGGGIPLFGKRAKPKIDTGEDVVSPYLWTRSIRRIDVLVSTHGHEDHMGGLPALLMNFRPKELWSGVTHDSELWRKLSEQARQSGTRLVSLRAGKNFNYGGARVQVLAPVPGYVPDEKPQNNDSLAFRIAYGSRSLLLTGDIESAVEREIAAEPSDVLKVAHHGSRTSSTPEFLDAVRPAFAIISAGFDNRYHLPHKVVLGTLAGRHTAVLRTDQNGLVTVRTDGRRMEVETWKGNHGISLYGPWGGLE